MPSNANLTDGRPTEDYEGDRWNVVTCRRCAAGMASGAFEELLAVVADTERNWRLDDFLELRAHLEGW